jgi:hypothetical protein
MMLNPRIVKALSLCALCFALAACSGASKKTDSYVSSTGVATILDNDKESCTRSCNAEYDRCGDTSAAQSPVGRGQFTGIFGAQADCKTDLRSCFARCKAR